MPKTIHDVGEKPLVLYSEVQAPLESLEFLPRALVFAELAMIAYNDQREADMASTAIGFPEARLLEHDGAQALQFTNDTDCVIACRGTELNEWNDVQADANASMAVMGTLGKVHSGFHQEVEDIWPQILEAIKQNSKTLWLCGHSLGGAIATICAFRCQQEASLADPRELHTFGSPRVGCKRYVKHADVQHFRWVHNNDLVTRLPPAWMGYRHGGEEIYLDRHGRIRKLKGLRRSRDRWRGFWKGLWGGKLDMLSDHSIHQYAGHIARAVEEGSGFRV